MDQFVLLFIIKLPSFTFRVSIISVVLSQIIHRRYTEDTQKIHRRYTEDTQKMHRRCTEDAQKMHRRCTEDAQIILIKYDVGTTQALT
jgi:hypothetical protein